MAVQAKEKDAMLAALEAEVQSLVNRLRNAALPIPQPPEESEPAQAKLKRALRAANARVASLQKSVDVLQAKLRTLQMSRSSTSSIQHPAAASSSRRSSYGYAMPTASSLAGSAAEFGVEQTQEEDALKDTVRNLSREFEDDDTQETGVEEKTDTLLRFRRQATASAASMSSGGSKPRGHDVSHVTAAERTDRGRVLQTVVSQTGALYSTWPEPALPPAVYDGDARSRDKGRKQPSLHASHSGRPTR